MLVGPALWIALLPDAKNTTHLMEGSERRSLLILFKNERRMHMPEDRYKQITDAFYELYNSFRASGFDDAAALELTKAYCNNSVLDSFVRTVREDKQRAIRNAVLERMRTDGYE